MSKHLGLNGIPFIRTPEQTSETFSDIGSSAGVDDPQKMLEGWTGWGRAGRALQPDVSEEDLFYEATIGRYQTSPAALLQLLSERRRAVAVISCEGRNYKGVDGRWSGTAFLVARNLLLTNHHVLNTSDVAGSATVEFDYEISPDNLLKGDGRTLPTPQSFRLAPARLFVTSPTLGGLDYTFVWIEEAAADKFGFVPLERSSFTVAKKDQAFVIHHPEGQHKQVSLDDNDIVGIDANVIHYGSDTLEGSSGAPVFDRRGRLVALHHASRDWSGTLPDGEAPGRINEGIKIAAIALDLETRLRNRGADGAHAETILREIKGSDTLSGFFGGYGRTIDSGITGPEAVVDTYRGTDQDIDIGFWNIEWLANRWERPGKLDGAAKIIADLNLDVWGLSEISPAAVEALVERLETTYGERFEFALSEPQAPSSKQSTAMIWKASSLSGERIEWPEKWDRLFRARSDDPSANGTLVEAVEGKIFDRYPALYRFSTAKGHHPYKFYAVPLHLKAMAEGSMRRQRASLALARAVAELMEREKLDVILGGDVNAPLASGDFKAIEDAGFTLLGAQDEQEGGFSYIQSPKSSIDNIFLSPGMRQTVGRVDYFIVAKDRTMPDYLAISDHRPVAARLSFSRVPGEHLLDRDALNAELDRMLEEVPGAPGKQRQAKVLPSDGPGADPKRGRRKASGAKAAPSRAKAAKSSKKP